MDAKDLQQHDLVPGIARRVVAAAGVGAGDTVLEVGPGRGRLTGALLARGATVHAVELDPDRLALLRDGYGRELADGRLVLHAGDARVLAPRLPDGWRVVANPPFRLGAELLKRWLVEDLPGGAPARIDLVLQREAAARFTPITGTWTRIAALVELWGEAADVLDLRRSDVEPPSKVDLCSWKLVRSDWAKSPTELALVDRLLDHAYAGPTSVREALKGIATRKIVDRQAGTHRWDPDGPPRRVPPKAWLAFASYLREVGKL